MRELTDKLIRVLNSGDDSESDIFISVQEITRMHRSN